MTGINLFSIIVWGIFGHTHIISHRYGKNLGILKTNKQKKTTKLGLLFACVYSSIIYSVTVNVDIALNKHMNQ